MKSSNFLSSLSSDFFLLIGCDGVWDVISNQEAVDFVGTQLNTSLRNLLNSPSPISCLKDENIQQIASKVCDDLLFECFQRNSLDNMTLLLILFPAAIEYLLSHYRQDRAHKSRETIINPKTPVAAPNITCESPVTSSPIYLPGSLGDDRGDVFASDERRRAQQGDQCEDVESSSPMKATKLFENITLI
jgi:hypothetical protein